MSTHRQHSPHDDPPELASLIRIDGDRTPSWTASRFNVRAITEDDRLILWNSYSNSLNVFSAAQRGALLDLLRGVTRGKREGIIGYLADRGFLVPEGTDEVRRVRYSLGQDHYRTDDLELILLASEDCNFRCDYCYEDFNRGTMKPAVRDGIKKLVESRVQHLRRLQILWFGGEPLYGMAAIDDLAPFFSALAEKHDLRFYSHMTTNGYMMTSEVVDKLLAWRIDDFQVTLDGLAEQHDVNRPTRDGQGTFETIYANLEAMRQRRDTFTLNLRINFDHGNHPHLGRLLEKLEKSFAGDSRFVLRFHAVGRWGGANDAELDVCGTDEAPRIGRELREAARQHGLDVRGNLRDVKGPGSQVCYAARPYSFTIGADGHVMKCTVTLDKDASNVVGQLDADGKLNLDDDKMALWTEPSFETDPQCARCVLVPTCQGMACPQKRIEQGKRRCPDIRLDLKNHMREILSVNERAARQAAVRRSA